MKRVLEKETSSYEEISKSQQTINSDVSTKIGQATLQTSSQNLSGATNELKGRADTLDSKYDNVVTVANTQPSSEYNKVWLPLTVNEGTQVPTWAEHQELSGAINAKIVRYSNITLSSSITNGQLARVPSSGTDSKLTEDSTVFEVVFSNPSAILSNITVNKYAGYFTLVGTTAASAGTVDIKMGNP